MDGKKLQCVMAAALLLHGGIAWAAVPVCVADDPRPAPMLTAPVSGKTIDPATGATIEWRRGLSGQVTVKLTSDDVSIHRVFNRGSAETTLNSHGKRLTILVASSNIVISTPDGSWYGTTLAPETLSGGIEYVRESPAARAAKDLLDRVALRANVIQDHALLLTRGLLRTIYGESTGVTDHQRWARTTVERPRVVRARLPGGPGECWNLYAAEAIRIANDLTSCATDCGFRLWCGRGCGFLYEIRAEAAFMWFMSCSGGFYVG